MNETVPIPEYQKILETLARLTFPVVKLLPLGLLPQSGTNTQPRQWSQHLLGLHKKDPKTLRQIIQFMEKSGNTLDPKTVANLIKKYKEVNPELFAEIPKPSRVIRTDELAVADQAVPAITEISRPVLRSERLANAQPANTLSPQTIFSYSQETSQEEIIDKQFILKELEELRKCKVGTPLMIGFQDNDSVFEGQTSYIDNSNLRLDTFMDEAESKYFESDYIDASKPNPFKKVNGETLVTWKDRVELLFNETLSNTQKYWNTNNDKDHNKSLLRLLCLKLGIEKLTETIKVQNPALQRPENRQKLNYSLEKSLEKQFDILSGLKNDQSNISSQFEQLIKCVLFDSINGELSQKELFQPLYEISQNLESLPEIVQKHYQNLTHLLSSYEENLLNLGNFCDNQANFNHRIKDDIQNIFLLQGVFANASLKLADQYIDYQDAPAKSIEILTNIYRYLAKALDQLYQKAIDIHDQYFKIYNSANRFTRENEIEKPVQIVVSTQTVQTPQLQKLITVVPPSPTSLERSISQPFRLPGVVSLSSFYMDNSITTYPVNSLYENISSPYPDQDADKHFRQKLISLKLLSSLPTLSTDHSNQSLLSNILESLPRITQIRSALVKSLYHTCFEPFVEHDLHEHLEHIYSDLPFKENGVLEYFSASGIVLNELSEVPTNKISSLFPDTSLTESEQQYKLMLSALESEKIMQIQRNISFMFGALDTQDYADTDLTICITEAIKSALLPKLENNLADLSIIQNPDITTSELMQMVSKYGLNIENYQTIRDYVAYKGAFVVKHIDDQGRIFFKLIVPRLDQPYLTDIIFACADDILPPDIHIKRDRINGTNYLNIIYPYPKTFGDRAHLPQTQRDGRRNAKSSENHSSPTKPTFISTIEGDNATNNEILAQQGQTSQSVNNIQDRGEKPQNLPDGDELNLDERSNQIAVKTSFVLTDEQLQIIRSGDQNAINNLIDQLTAQQGLSRKRAESVKPVPKPEPAKEEPKEFILSVNPVMNKESKDLIISSILPIINKLIGTLQTQIEHVQCLRKLSSTGNKRLDNQLAKFLKDDRLKFYQDVANQSIVFNTNIADILIRGWTCSTNERFSDYLMVSDEFVKEIFSPNEALFGLVVTDENRYMYEGTRQGKTRITDYNIAGFSKLPQHFIELAIHGLRTTLNKMTDSSDLSDLNFKIQIESEKFIRNIPKTDLKNTFSRHNIIDLVSNFNKYLDLSTAPIEQLEKNQKKIRNPIARALFDAVVDERRAISELKSLDGSQTRFYTVFSTQSFKSDLLKILLEPANYQYWSLSNSKSYRKSWDLAKTKVLAKIENNQKVYPSDVNALTNSNSIFLLYHSLTFESKDLNWGSDSENIRNIIHDVDLIHQLGENYQEAPAIQTVKGGMRKTGLREINLNEVQGSDDIPVDQQTQDSLKGQIELVLQKTQVYQNDVEMVSDLVYSLKNSTNPKISYPSDSFAAGVWNMRKSKIWTNSGDVSDYIAFEKGFLKGVKEVVLSKKFLEKSFGKANLPLEINLAEEKCEETLGIMLGSTIMQGIKLPDENQNKTIFDKAFTDFISIPIPHLYFAFLTDVDIGDFDNFKAWLNTLK